MAEVSVVIPAYNESGAVGETVEAIKRAFAGTAHTFEIIVVDDGSSDDTAAKAEAAGARVVRHPCNIGYGNSIQTGARHARYPLIAMTDADGTYPVDALPSMVDEVAERGLDMLVGARKGKHYHGSLLKRLARVAFKFLSEFTVGRRIPDINSGLRVLRREVFSDYSSVLCGGFSFSTTITIITMLSNRFIAYRDIAYHERKGKSKVRYSRDILTTTQLLVTTILVFNPIKLYIVLAAGVLLAGALAVLTCLIFPALTAGVVLASAFFLVASVLMGMGFLAEQRRATPKDFDPFKRRT